MSIFFTSDEHYFHENIIKYCNRPFANAAEMNEKLIEEHNAMIGPNDHVYHLGDFTFRSPFTAADIIMRLNGHHHFISGNHDEWQHSKDFDKAMATCFESTALEEVQAYKELRFGHNNEKVHIVLFHFPLLTWHKGHKGSIHLHGHTHANIDELNEKTNIKRFDMGVDSAFRRFGKYRPFTLNEVLDLAREKPANIIDFGGE